MNSKTMLRPWLMWALAAFFFFAHYVIRVTPGQITTQIQMAFASTSKFDIGVLGAAFYLPYVFMQMPVGLLVDRLGIRLLLSIAVGFCSLSAFLFANAQIFETAILSRALLGLCSATAFIGALKLITHWFKPTQLALLVGITQALGMMGASFGTGVVPWITDTLGWRQTFTAYAWLFIILAMLMFVVIKNKPSIPETTKNPKNSSIRSVLMNRYTWINALFAGLIYAPSDTMGELWGKEFLENIHGLDSHFASSCIAALFIGWAIGGPLAGALADRVGRRPVMIGSALCGLIILPIIFYTDGLSPFFLLMSMFIYGFTNTGLIACYATAGELHANNQAGLSLGITNMCSVLIGAVLMPILGALLEWQQGSAQMLHYSASDYRKATIILPLCLIGAFICACCMKETLACKKLNH